LRQLLSDAIAAGVVERRPGQLDKRRIVYCLTEEVRASWDTLFQIAADSLADVLATLEGNALADIDYRIWNPGVSARHQFPERAVCLYLKSARLLAEQTGPRSR